MKLLALTSVLLVASGVTHVAHSQNLPTEPSLCPTTSPKGTFSNPASSCNEAVQNILNFQPGLIWVRDTSGRAKLVYCTASTQCCNQPGGWMRIAYLDMTNLDHKCPSGFQLMTSPKRLCVRTASPGCTSIVYSTSGISYSKVCGRVRAYYYNSADAFHPYYRTRHSLENLYVDGVSVTHGHPRRHIWTFAAGTDEQGWDIYSCPCARNNSTFIGLVPPFIGNDYFCEAARTWNGTVTDDPLWDGMGCPSSSTCCSSRNPPWFCKTVTTTTDAIEVRVCRDEDGGNEDVQLELIEIFVQ